jgi:hypothetical protein
MVATDEHGPFIDDLPIKMSLVGGLKHEFYVPFHIWDVILPIDELIFFKMVIAPPTIRNHMKP